MASSLNAVVDSNDDKETASASSDAASDPLNAPKRKFQDVDVWADESDNEWEKFKQMQKPARAKKKTKTARKASSKRYRDSPLDFASRLDEDAAPDGQDEINVIVPEHIAERRTLLDENRKLLGASGLRLPPDYSDVYFSDDEKDPEELKERPKLNVAPCRPYKDIVLESGSLIPASIAQYLRDYQVDGVKFLHERFVFQRGAILGDDMGLGKTVQVAAFLTAAFGKTGDERDGKRLRKMRRHSPKKWYPRVLIIAPGSLIANWRSELKRWGWWSIEVYHGSGKEDALRAAQGENRGNLEIMITTYSTYKNDEEKINRVPWDAVIADECHQIKERKAAITKAMDKVNALCRIGLTGTAIQNKYEEFWTLLNWTNPGHFGTPREWKHSIVQPLTRGQSHEATWKQLSLARITAKKLVQNLLPPFFLRRMKSLISHQLPKKSDRVVFCPLTTLQKTAYENLLESEEVSIILASSELCGCGSGTKQGWCCEKRTADGKSWMSLVFPAIQALQKISNHLTLLIPGDEKDEKKRKADLIRLEKCIPEDWKMLYKKRNSIHTLANAEFCGKWKILKKLLGFWHNNKDKVLVFSHSVRLLDILSSLFKSTSYSVSFLSGQLSYDERQDEVDNFNNDSNKFVFLISTKAGGVGLNITSANKVVIFDPHWNPSYDLQAQDRAYRIGQLRDVEVFRLVSAGTIEEIVYARQIYKQQQANIGYNASNERRYFKGVQQDSARKGELFGLQNLFTFHGDQIVLQGIMNQTNIAEARVGAQLAEIDMSQIEQDEDEPFTQVKKEESGEDDSGLSQLAAYIKTENPEARNTMPKKPKNDGAIQAILASVGVQYTHENSEVIGSSKVEAHLSRRAEMAADMDLDELTGDPSALFEDEKHPQGSESSITKFTPQFNPPQEVVQRQFCSMAKEFGYENVTDFALAVEEMTQEERRDILDTFYKKRMALLLKEELGRGEDVDEKKVNILKAEVDAFDDQKVKLQDEGHGIKIKTEVAEHGADARWNGKLENISQEQEEIKSESSWEPDSTEKASATTTIGPLKPMHATQSIFLYDDDDDDDEL